MKHVHIDKIAIRVRGLSPEAAQEAVAGLGEEIRRRLIQRAEARPAPPGFISSVDVGSVHVDSRSGAGAATRTIGKAITSAIDKKK